MTRGATPTFALLTPSYAPDLDQFRELRATVEAYLPPGTPHVVVVPTRDVDLFSGIGGVQIVDEATLMPRRFRKLPYHGWWVNSRRPWWPVRGWVLQQALKLAVAATLPYDHVVVVDSDIAFIRPFSLERYLGGATTTVFRRERAVHAGLPRHVRWHAVARALLGLPADGSLPQPDYVSSLNIWAPARVRAMTDHIAQSTGRPWFDAVTSEPHISEFTLYGVFADHLPDGDAPSPIGRWCCDYWDETPLDPTAADDLVAEVRPEDVAIMVSAKSRTPGWVRNRVISGAQAVAERQERR